MAGQGKGILRVAFEDFLETFDPSNMFENFFGSIAKYLMDNVFGEYVTLVESIADASKLQALANIVHTHSSKGQTITKFGFYLFMTISIITSMGNAYLAPFAQQVTYVANNNALPGRLSIADMLNLYQKDKAEYEKRKRTLGDLGYTEDVFLGIDKAAKTEMELGLLIASYWRQTITADELKRRIEALGLNEERTEDILKAASVLPSTSDLVHMADRWAWDENKAKHFRFDEEYPPEVEEWMKKQGSTADWFRKYWRSHWQLPGIDQIFEMYHRLRHGRSEVTFDDNDLQQFLEVTPYAPYWFDYFKAIAYQPITRVDIRRIYKQKIFDAAEVEQRYLDLGYNPKDAKVLADFTVKYEDASGNDIRDKYKELSFTLLRSLYQKGKITLEDLKTRLGNQGYDDTEIALIVDYFGLAAVDSSSVDYKAQFISEMIKFTEDAYQLEMVSKDEANNTLRAIGLSDSNVNYILQRADYAAKLDDLNTTLKKIHDSYVAGAMTRNEMIAELGSLGISGSQQNRVISQMELDLKYPNRRLTETQYRAAVTRGIIGIDEYKANLIGLGYTQYDIDLLVSLNFPGGT